MTRAILAPSPLNDGLPSCPDRCDPTLCITEPASPIDNEPFALHRAAAHSVSLTDVEHDSTRVQILWSRFDRPGKVGADEYTVRIGDNELELTLRVLDGLQSLIDAARSVTS